MVDTTTVDADSNSAATDDGNERRGLFGRLIGTSFIGQVIRAVLVPVILYVLLFVVALWRAFVDPEGSAEYFTYLRNLIDILLSSTLIVVFIGAGILIVQIARFINLLRSEIKPITRDTRAAIANVRTTSAFVKKQAAEPIIRTQSFMFGLLAFLREIVRISRILRRRNGGNDATE